MNEIEELSHDNHVMRGTLNNKDNMNFISELFC